MKKRLLISLSLIFAMAVTSAVAFAATGTSKYTGKNYTHNSKFDNSVIVNAIDISQHQYTIDWNKVKADGIDFAIIRVGGRGYGESGRLYFDDYYKSNLAGAKQAGVAIGIYYFSQAKTEAEAVEEAQRCLALLRDAGYSSSDIEFPIFMDYEHASDSANPGRIKDLSKEQRTLNALAFCNTIKNAGYEAGFYSNLLFLRNSVDGSKLSGLYTIWAAQYNYECNYEHAYDIWQYSSDGSVSGINGRVDCNFWYIDKNPKASQAKSIVNCKVEVNDVFYEGIKNYEPAVKVTYNGQVLTEGKDYKVAYVNNRSKGSAYAYVRGVGQYADHQLKTFKIMEGSSINEEAGVKSEAYQIGDYVTGVTLGTDLSDFKNNISLAEGYEYKVITSAGLERQSGIVGTGDMVIVYDKDGVYSGSAAVVVRGDSDGDGKCGLKDILMIKKHIMGIQLCTGSQKIALDVRNDGSIGLIDLLAMKKHYMNIEYITN